MAEQLDLTTPITGPTTSNLMVVQLGLDWEAAMIHIGVKNTVTGYRQHFDYTGSTATNLMVALNKANLSTKSLQRRILEQLVADGKLVGTISGTPD